VFAIATQDLREMVIMPEVARIPNVPDYVRGVINLRGRVMPLLDLRKRIGLPSAVDETESFCAMLQQREQDHRNWLKELEASVRERRPFALTTDPHKCAFGKWYDTYHDDNPWVAALLKKFDEPHQQIHGIAIEAGKLVERESFDEALGLLAQTRDGVLSRLIELFAELRALRQSASRETAVILRNEGKEFAISVDLAVSIEKLPPDAIEEVSSAVPLAADAVVRRLGKRAKSNDVVLILETDRLMAGCQIDSILASV
jgi:purine-binding chemotaxis protein CheW